MPQQKTALITGATSGIGFALAHVFARNQYNLVVVARDAQKLETIKKSFEQQYHITVHPYAQDLTSMDAAQKIYTFCKQQTIPVDVLVNNAGIGVYGAFAAQDESIQTNMIRLNIEALTHLTRLFVPDMVTQKSGKILNVASTAAFQAGPLFAVYYATKAYVLSLSEALHHELFNNNIAVSCLCPGPTKTEFFNTNSEVNQTRLIKAGFFMDPVRVAEIGYRGLMRNQAVVIPGVVNSLVAFFSQILPRKMIVAISAMTLKKSS